MVVLLHFVNILRGCFNIYPRITLKSAFFPLIPSACIELGFENQYSNKILVVVMSLFIIATSNRSLGKLRTVYVH